MNKDLTVSMLHIENLFLSRAMQFSAVYVFVPLIMHVALSITVEYTVVTDAHHLMALIYTCLIFPSNIVLNVPGTVFNTEE